MSIEFIGSFLVFSFILLFGNLRNRWIFYLGAGIALANTYYLAFIFGMLLSDIHNRNGSKTTIINNAYVVFGLFVLGLILGSYEDPDWYRYPVINIFLLFPVDPISLFHIAGAFLVLLSLLNSKLLVQTLSGQVPVFFGKISFMLYLLHLLVIYSLSSFLFINLNRLFSYDLSLLITFILTLPFTIILAYLTYKYVDEPGTKLSKRVYEKYFTGVEGKPLIIFPSLKNIVSFAQNHIKLLIIAEFVLLISIGSMVFVAMPIVDQSNADHIKTAYSRSLHNTTLAYYNLSTYPEFNGTSPAMFSKWADGYELLAEDLSSNYNEMNYYALMAGQYMDTVSKQQVEANISYYGAVVNESNNNSALYHSAYESAYNDWLWKSNFSSTYS